MSSNKPETFTKVYVLLLLSIILIFTGIYICSNTSYFLGQFISCLLMITGFLLYFRTALRTESQQDLTRPPKTDPVVKLGSDKGERSNATKKIYPRTDHKQAP
jgi:general stress protein CsbA